MGGGSIMRWYLLQNPKNIAMNFSFVSFVAFICRPMLCSAQGSGVIFIFITKHILSNATKAATTFHECISLNKEKKDICLNMQSCLGFFVKFQTQ